jgi:hypothetical protein
MSSKTNDLLTMIESLISTTTLGVFLYLFLINQPVFFQKVLSHFFHTLLADINLFV